MVQGTLFLLHRKSLLESINQIVDDTDLVALNASSEAAQAGGIVESIREIARILQQSSANSEEVAALSEEQSAGIVEFVAAIDALASITEEANELVRRFRV